MRTIWYAYRGIGGVFLALLALITCAVAQDITGKIDLESRPGTYPSVAGGGIAYKPTLADCPAFDWQFVASGGSLYFVRKISFLMKKGAENGTSYVFRAKHPLDEQTYEFIVESRDCRFVADIRQQVRSRGGWNNLFVKKALGHAMSDNTQMYSTGGKELNSESGKIDELRGTTPNGELGNLDVGDGYQMIGYVFDGGPSTCLNMFGNFELGRNYMSFYFPIRLVPELNKFQIERVDTNDRQILYFLKGDCRFQITVQLSLLVDGKWTNRVVDQQRQLRFLIQRQ
jgi:hypothetical protein